MKETCMRFFTFRGEDFHSTEQYLNQMLTQGWRLRWCKGIFASFEKTEETNIRYVVDPFALTSPTNLKRFPKYRLNEYMENGWYALSKNKGTYIFYTDDPSAEQPALEDHMAAQVKRTCALSSLVVAILLLATLWRCFTTSAVLYSILLTDIYIVLSVAAVFLILYHLGNAFLLFQKPSQQPKTTGCKRYIVHDGMLFLLLLSVIILEARQQTSMLLYLLLPIGVVIIGTLVLKLAAKGSKDAKDSNRRLIPVICIIGAVLMVLIPLSFQRLQSSSEEAGQQRQTELLTIAETLPVLRLEALTDAKNVSSAIKENNSILGENMLYAEESGDLAIFTNRCTMKNESLATFMFDYLYFQAQMDYKETFAEKKFNDITYFALEKANTYLLQKGAVVYLCTVPQGVTADQVLTLLSTYL